MTAQLFLIVDRERHQSHRRRDAGDLRRDDDAGADGIERAVGVVDPGVEREVERAEDEPLDARTSRDVEHVPQPGRGLDDRDDDVLGRDRGEDPLDVRRAVGLRSSTPRIASVRTTPRSSSNQGVSALFTRT